jgi:hypothetical protein
MGQDLAEGYLLAALNKILIPASLSLDLETLEAAARRYSAEPDPTGLPVPQASIDVPATGMFKWRQPPIPASVHSFSGPLTESSFTESCRETASIFIIICL